MAKKPVRVPKVRRVVKIQVTDKAVKKQLKRKGHHHPNSLKALEANKWKPGQSGNPAGRPKGIGEPKVILSKAYRMALEQEVPEEFLESYGLEAADIKRLKLFAQGKQLTFAELIAFGQAQAAMLGITAAAKELREATEGKTPDKIQHLDKDGNPADAPTNTLNIGFVAPKKEAL